MLLVASRTFPQVHQLQRIHDNRHRRQIVLRVGTKSVRVDHRELDARGCHQQPRRFLSLPFKSHRHGHHSRHCRVYSRSSYR